MDANTKYNPFNRDGGWTYGERFYRSTHRWDYAHYLGPCPQCGTACFDYGGGWRCLSRYCFNSASNPIPNLGPRPDWWNTNILVEKDGNAWCAHYDDFINLMESPCEFGSTPQEAIDKLRTLTPAP